MREVTVPLGERTYKILIGSGILGEIGARVRQVGIAGALALVQDANVAGPYGGIVRRSLEASGYRVSVFTVPPGEGSKCLDQLGALYDAFAGARIDRRSAVVALGGGVVGDLAGFAAASYLRGIDFIQVPTTLLAQVDSSVGGKTGIDLSAGKNLVGAFHQPRLVLADLDTLATLPERELVAGMAEVIKYGIIMDPEFFEFLEVNHVAVYSHQPDAMAHVIARSCELKAEVVSKDERESGLRAILNYGHTIGHAVEAAAGYGRYLHGEAIAIGTVAAGKLSQMLAGLSDADAERIEALLLRYRCPVRLREPLAEQALFQAMLLDKKTRGDELRFVLARRIGDVFTASVAPAAVQSALAAIAPDGNPAG